jgi:hypothetical protein
MIGGRTAGDVGAEQVWSPALRSTTVRGFPPARCRLLYELQVRDVQADADLHLTVHGD